MVALVSDVMNLKNGGVISLVGAGGKTSLMYRLAAEFASKDDFVLSTTTTKIMMPSLRQSSLVIFSNSAESLLNQAKVHLIDNRHLSAASNRIANFPQKLCGFSPRVINEIWDAGLFKWIIVEADGAARRPIKAPADHEPVIPQSSTTIIGVVGLRSLGKPVGEKWVFRHDRYSAITGLSEGDPITEKSIAEAALHENGFFKNSPDHAKKILFLNAANHSKGIATGKVIANHLKKSSKGAKIKKILVGQPLDDKPITACFDVG